MSAITHLTHRTRLTLSMLAVTACAMAALAIRGAATESRRARLSQHVRQRALPDLGLGPLDAGVRIQPRQVLGPPTTAR